MRAVELVGPARGVDAGVPDSGRALGECRKIRPGRARAGTEVGEGPTGSSPRLHPNLGKRRNIRPEAGSPWPPAHPAAPPGRFARPTCPAVLPCRLAWSISAAASHGERALPPRLAASSDPRAQPSCLAASPGQRVRPLRLANLCGRLGWRTCLAKRARPPRLAAPLGERVRPSRLAASPDPHAQPLCLAASPGQRVSRLVQLTSAYPSPGAFARSSAVKALGTVGRRASTVTSTPDMSRFGPREFVRDRKPAPPQAGVPGRITAGRGVRRAPGPRRGLPPEIRPPAPIGPGPRLGWSRT